MTRWPAGVVASLLIVASIAGAQEPPVAPVDPERIDRFTSADPGAARVTHVSLDLRLDFAERRAMGTARLRVQLARGASAIVVDTKDLDIEGVTNLNNQPMPYVLGEVDAVRGRPLVVSLPEPARTPATVTFTIAYRTQPHGAALQWLAPGQTVGGVRPYVYSQGQAILTRSWIPTQDSPGLRQTYDARIVVPEGLRVVMSAESLTPDGEPVEGMTGVRAFRFRMTQSIPPYLIALAAGDIAFKPIGTRTGVFAEPAMLAAAAAEFADVDRMLAAAETIAGPYRWRRYDVLVLPPAFPYGGMENPRLTFVSPSIVAGDRSLVSVVAHEIAHSWAGNLVTNATWRDAWLNEGLATYLERRISEALHGPERARMLEQLGRAELLDELARLGPRSPDSQLHLPDTTGDPDATLSVVAYEKGAAFFRMLEETVGRARFDTYLRGYFQRFVFKTLTTTDFRADLREHLFGNDVSFDTRILLGDWLDAPGLPANIPPIDSEAFRAVDEIADAFAAGATLDELNPTLWSTQEWQRFITRLPAPLARERLEVLDARFRLSQRTNSEVLFAWLQLAARSQHAPATTAIEAFLTSTGRRKFVEPLYQALAASEWGRPIARRIFARARPSYHAVVAASIERLLAR